MIFLSILIYSCWKTSRSPPQDPNPILWPWVALIPWEQLSGLLRRKTIKAWTTEPGLFSRVCFTLVVKELAAGFCRVPAAMEPWSGVFWHWGAITGKWGKGSTPSWSSKAACNRTISRPILGFERARAWGPQFLFVIHPSVPPPCIHTYPSIHLSNHPSMVSLNLSVKN